MQPAADMPKGRAARRRGLLTVTAAVAVTTAAYGLVGGRAHGGAFTLGPSQKTWQQKTSPNAGGASAGLSTSKTSVEGAASATASASFGMTAAAAAALLFTVSSRARREGARASSVALAAVQTEEAPAVKVAAAPKAKAKGKAKAKAAPKAKAKRPPTPIMEQFTTGIMAPVVLAGYWLLGERFVDRVRGKGIGLHSQVINLFCATFAIPSRKRQGFIKTAKKTGHDLGFLIPGGWFGDGIAGEGALDWYKQSGIDRWSIS